MSTQLSICYSLISSVYGDRKTSRFPHIRLMDHINQGLDILDKIDASVLAKCAFCIHPLLQDDATCNKTTQSGLLKNINSDVIITAMNYRAVANEYINVHNQTGKYRTNPDFVWIKDQLDTFPDVRAMLIADKVQNKKDFICYRTDLEHRDYLVSYFNKWIDLLGLTSQQYIELALHIADPSKGEK